MKKHAIFGLLFAAAVAGCSTQKGGEADDEMTYMFGAVRYREPSVTNRYDGLTVYKKNKGKIYNSEEIIYCASDIDGFTVVEEDRWYQESIRSGSISNAWAYTTITNEGTFVKFQGSFEDEECWKSKDDDSFLGFVSEPSKLSPEQYKSLTNSETQVSIYRIEKFDEKYGTKYDRINTVLESAVTDRPTAIKAFNDLLSGLKGQ